MSIINIANQFQLIGRLVKDPKVFKHNDESYSILMTIAVKNNYRTTRNNKKDYYSNVLPVQKYIPKSDKRDPSIEIGIYQHLETGDLIGVNGHLESFTYQKDDETIYIQNNVIDELNTNIETKIAKNDRKRRKKQRETGSVTSELAPETEQDEADIAKALDSKTDFAEELQHPFGRSI